MSQPDLAPHMSEPERATLEDLFRSASIGLEFGMGGSTLLASRCGVPVYYSVDSSADWVARCSEHPEIAPLIQSGKWHLRHVDIGPTGRWGRPVDRSARDRWPDYHSAIWAEMADPPDLVFIDGRFRAACGLQAIARCCPGTIIAIHDYPSRGGYHVVERFLKIVASVDSLQVMRLDTPAAPDEVETALAKVAYSAT